MAVSNAASHVQQVELKNLCAFTYAHLKYTIWAVSSEPRVLKVKRPHVFFFGAGKIAQSLAVISSYLVIHARIDYWGQRSHSFCTTITR